MVVVVVVVVVEGIDVDVDDDGLNVLKEYGGITSFEDISDGGGGGGVSFDSILSIELTVR